MAHGLTKVWVTLHGGEPLLLGKIKMRSLLDTPDLTRTRMRPKSTYVCIAMGVLLDEQWCGLFR